MPDLDVLGMQLQHRLRAVVTPERLERGGQVEQGTNGGDVDAGKVEPAELVASRRHHARVGDECVLKRH